MFVQLSSMVETNVCVYLEIYYTVFFEMAFLWCCYFTTQVLNAK